MSDRYNFNVYKKWLKMKTQVRESKNLLVLSLLRGGVDEQIIAQSVDVDMEDILELKGLIEVGYGDYVHDLEHARKRRIALNMLKDNVDEKIIATVSGLEKDEVVKLGSASPCLDNSITETGFQFKDGWENIH